MVNNSSSSLSDLPKAVRFQKTMTVDPFNFKPERFFNAEGNLDYAAIDPVKYSFGFGRR